MPRSYATPPVGELLRRYRSAGDALSCEPVAQGLLNRGYRLATTHGDYFLKHHLDGDPAAISRQHRATQRLQTLGVPVAPPLADTDGDTVTVIGGRCYALHPWIDGRHREGAQLSTACSRRLGALLGLVHTGLERVMEAESAPPSTRAPTPPTPSRSSRSCSPGWPAGGPAATPSTSWPSTGCASAAACWSAMPTVARRRATRAAGCTATSIR